MSRLVAVSGLLYLLSACGSSVLDSGNNNTATRSLGIEIIPANSQTYNSSRTVTIEGITDSTSVSKVRFYDGNSYRGTDYSAPYIHKWTISQADNGKHAWKVIAYDNNGNNISDSVDLTVAISPGELLWSKRLGGADDDIGYATAVDASGNRIVAGAFQNSANFGGGTVSSAGGYDIFVVKYSSSGAYLWSRTFGGTGDDRPRAVAFDSNGNTVVAGYFQNTINFGGDSLTSNGGYDLFVAKYSVAGEHLWSQHFGGTTDDQAFGVAVDSVNNVLVTGYFTNSVNFGGATLRSAQGAPATFIAKYSSSGVHSWSLYALGYSPDAGQGIAVDAADNVVVTGYLSGDTDFDATDGYGDDLLGSTGGKDIYVAKYSSGGAYLWGRHFGDRSEDSGQSVDIDRTTGDITVTGSFQGNVDFGGGKLGSTGVSDVFVARFSSTGNYRWAKHFGGSQKSTIGYGISVNNSGEIVTTGSFEGSVDFGGSALKSAGGADIFLAKFSKNGNHIWSQRFGGSNNDAGYAVAINNKTDDAALAGYFSNTVNFGGDRLTSAGGTDSYIAKVSP